MELKITITQEDLESILSDYFANEFDLHNLNGPEFYYKHDLISPNRSIENIDVIYTHKKQRS